MNATLNSSLKNCKLNPYCNWVHNNCSVKCVFHLWTEFPSVSGSDLDSCYLSVDTKDWLQIKTFRCCIGPNSIVLDVIVGNSCLDLKCVMSSAFPQMGKLSSDLWHWAEPCSRCWLWLVAEVHCHSSWGWEPVPAGWRWTLVKKWIE